MLADFPLPDMGTETAGLQCRAGCDPRTCLPLSEWSPGIPLKAALVALADSPHVVLMPHPDFDIRLPCYIKESTQHSAPQQQLSTCQHSRQLGTQLGTHCASCPCNTAGGSGGTCSTVVCSTQVHQLFSHSVQGRTTVCNHTIRIADANAHRIPHSWVLEVQQLEGSIMVNPAMQCSPATDCSLWQCTISLNRTCTHSTQH